MKSILEKVILASPVSVQNFAFSIYGLKSQYIRYGGNYTNYYNMVSSHLKYTQTELNAYIESALIKTINNAVENVPYYKALFRRKNIPSNAIKSIEDLKRIPILEKDEVASKFY